MGWRVRLASDTDRTALASFRCDSEIDCASCGPDGGNTHEREVQDYIQRHAVNAMLERAPTTVIDCCCSRTTLGSWVWLPMSSTT